MLLNFKDLDLKIFFVFLKKSLLRSLTLQKKTFSSTQNQNKNKL